MSTTAAIPAAQPNTQVRNYILVTAAYWADTLTDGALRMLVLLYFHKLGYSAFQVAMLRRHGVRSVVYGHRGREVELKPL